MIEGDPTEEQLRAHEILSRMARAHGAEAMIGWGPSGECRISWIEGPEWGLCVKHPSGVEALQILALCLYEMHVRKRMHMGEDKREGFGGAMADPRMRGFWEARHAALTSLDEKRIRNYGKKYGAKMAPPTDPALFWSSVHRARILLPSMDQVERLRSLRLLRELGERPPYAGDNLAARLGELDEADYQTWKAALSWPPKEG